MTTINTTSNAKLPVYSNGVWKYTGYSGGNDPDKSVLFCPVTELPDGIQVQDENTGRGSLFRITFDDTDNNTKTAILALQWLFTGELIDSTPVVAFTFWPGKSGELSNTISKIEFFVEGADVVVEEHCAWTSKIGTVEECATEEPPTQPKILIDWQEAQQQSLTATDTGWYWDGSWDGCDLCARNISPLGTWGNNFNYTHCIVTVNVHDSVSNDSRYRWSFVLATTTGMYSWQTEPFGQTPDALNAAGTYVLDFLLEDGYSLPVYGGTSTLSKYNETLPLDGDLEKLGLYCDIGGSNGNRSFTITDVIFS